MKSCLLRALAGAGLLMAGTLGIAESRAAANPDAAATAAVDAVLDRWIDAQGGWLALANLDALESDEQIDIEPAGRHLELHLLRTAAGHYRWEITAPSESAVIMAFDGHNVWVNSPRLGFGLLPPGPVPSAVRQDDVWNANRVRRLYPIRSPLPDATFSGQSCHVLAMTGASGIKEFWALAKDSGQLVRIEFPVGPHIPADIVVEYSDFRRVGEVVLPFETHAAIGPNVRTVVHRLKAAVDPAIQPAVFAVPSGRLQEAKTVAEILRRHLAASGGASSILAIHSRVTHMTQEQTSAGSKSQITVSQKLPNFILVEEETAGMGHSAEGYDGHTGWSNGDLQGFRTLKGVELQQLLAQADLHQELNLSTGSPLRRYLGTREVKGRLADVIALATMSETSGTYYFDREDASLLRVESALFGDAKTLLPVTVDFSNYRAIDGVKVPFVVTTTNPGVQLVTTVQSLENNVPLDDALFKPQHDE